MPCPWPALLRSALPRSTLLQEPAINQLHISPQGSIDGNQVNKQKPADRGQYKAKQDQQQDVADTAVVLANGEEQTHDVCSALDAKQQAATPAGYSSTLPILSLTKRCHDRDAQKQMNSRFSISLCCQSRCHDSPCSAGIK